MAVTRETSSTPPERDLLLSEVTAFEAALDAGRTIAVTGEPYAGRGSVLEYAADVLDTELIRLDPGEPAGRLELGAGPLVVDDCQQLYTRRVGGFDQLRETLTALLNSDQPVVTGWNTVAWVYLDRVEAIGDAFDEEISVQQLSADELEAYVRERREIPTIEGDDLGDSVVSAEEYSAGWVDLRVPKIDLGVLNDQIWPTPVPARAFFDRLRSLSRGNPGVALALLDQLDDEPVSPSDLTTPSVDLDETGDFLLRLLLGSERADPGLLADRIGSRFERLVGRLDRAGITTRDGDSLVLTPLGVPTALERSEWRRIL
jgi:hypothetical protein